MRKFLSLVLALVMMMSLVTINVGAKEFTDGDDITYQEAVDVISTIHVVDGYNDGGFKPGNNLSRGAAAKIICNMILGPTTAAELHADTAPYRDVPVTSEFAGYIAYCQKEGIISGYADGTFRPAGTLTGYAFMKMLLGALGYDAEIEGYTGPNWSINVAKKAIGLGLNNSLEKTFNGVDFVTREEAALYAFNTLKADLVEYSSKITASVNGAQVTVGNSNAEPQKWESQQTRSDNIYRDQIVQFAEQYFNKLVLTEDMDCFGRPDREWKFDGEDIGAYVNMDLFKQEYTAKVTGRDLYDLLGSTVTKEYGFDIHIDGVETVANKAILDPGFGYFSQGNLVRTNTEEVGKTGNGVLTQVFVDNDKDVEHVWIAVINTYLAKATDDYNEKKDEAYYDVWSVDDKGGTTSILVKDKNEVTPLTVSGEDFDIEDVKENDIVLVHVADGEIKEFVDPEVIDNTTISSFKKDNWVNAEGTQYDYASSIQYDLEVLEEYDRTNMKDTEYRIFLDEYGYAIGIEIIEEPAQYVFLTGIDLNKSNLANKTADGNVIHTDGTMETVRINMDKSVNALGNKFSAGNDVWDPVAHAADPKAMGTGVSALMNTWCRYTVNSAGVYTLTEVANSNYAYIRNAAGNLYGGTKTDKAGQGRNVDMTNSTANPELVKLDKSHIYLNGITDTASGVKRVYTNDDTVFLSVVVDEIEKVSLPQKINGTTTIEESGTTAVIISDVDSVSTGHQNVNLKAWNAAQVLDANDKFATANKNAVSNGVYTLFDSDGFVIAAVIVGEDDGTTTNYAFALTDTYEQEDWSKEDDEWTWSRKVVVNGEVVVLTEKGDGNPELGNMAQGEWAEVKYKADGTVRSVTNLSNHIISPALPKNVPVNDFDGYPTGHSPWLNTHGKFIQNIKDVEAATDTFDTVLLWDNMTDATREITAEGHSLQVKTSDTSKDGFSVNPNAKVVLVQDVYRSKDGVVKAMDSVEEFTGGMTGLKRALKRLNDDNMVPGGDYVEDSSGAFRGFVGAVLENGMATSIVIYDKTANYLDMGSDVTPLPSGDTMDIVVNIYVGNSILSSRSYKFADNGAGVAIVKPGQPDATGTTVAVPDGYENPNPSAQSVLFAKDGKDTVDFYVTIKTHALTDLPADVTYSWPANAALGITAGSGTGNGTDDPAVPHGADVTLTLGAAATNYVKYTLTDVTGDVYAQSGSTINFTMTKDMVLTTTLTDKYSKMVLTPLETAPVVDELNGALTLTAAITAAASGGQYQGDWYAKDGTAVTVTFTLAEVVADSGATVQTKPIKAVLTGAGVTSGSFATSANAFAASAGKGTKTDTVTLDAASALSYTFGYTLANA